MTISLRFGAVLAIAIVSLAGGARSEEGGEVAFTCAGDGSVCRYDDTSLPAKVLMRPASTVYQEPDEASAVLASNLPAFRPWYVFDSRGVDLSDPSDPKGWYQLGVERDKEPFGWVKANDAMLWRNALVVTYTNRGAGAEEDKRSPVLMFGTLDELKAMMQDAEPGPISDALVDAIYAGDSEKAQSAGVVMMEPRRFVDFKSGFYILPVVDFERFTVGLDNEARYLRLAAAIPQGDTTGRGVTTTQDEDTRNDVAEGESGQMAGAKDLGIDIKFVLDMTGSMQPYLDATRKAVGRVITSIEELGLSRDVVQYGLIGYTDVSDQCGHCGFTVVKNFTPEPVDGAKISEILAKDRSAQANDGGDWPETVFAGVEEAIQSGWRENTLRFVIVIGDAYSKDVAADGSGRTTATSVRSLANDAAGERSVFIIAMHARPTQVRQRDNDMAENQFRELARNPGTQSTSYLGFQVDMDNPTDIENQFQSNVREVADVLLGAISAVRGGDTSIVTKPSGGAGGGGVSDVVTEAVAAALVEYLGSETERPNDLTAWATDIDPRDPLVTSMDVRVLLEKRELSELIKNLEDLLSAYRRADITGKDFFEELQATVGGEMVGEGGTGRDAKRLAGSGLLPSWLNSLPYTSALLELTPETFANMTPDQREFFEADLEDKLNILSDYLNDPDVWHKLSPDVGELSAVYPVPLTDLP